MKRWSESVKSIAIVGTGLIGASLASALKASGYPGEIRGYSRRYSTAQKALEMGLVDSAHDTITDAVKDIDLVFLAVPMQAMQQILEQIAPVLPAHTIITDGGSVKGSFVSEARQVLGSTKRLVPGHPIAGKEHSGVEAADPSLYHGHLVILTPTSETDADAVDHVASMWKQCGARIETLPAKHHDRILAATSHLPHVVAFALVDMLASHDSAEEVFRYSAGGFRDFTRIASGDPVMWRDICLSNADPISEILSELIDQLGHAKELIQQQDGESLQRIFENSKVTRDALIERYDREQALQMKPLSAESADDREST